MVTIQQVSSLIQGYIGRFPDLTKDEFDFLIGSSGKEVMAYNHERKHFITYPTASRFIKENSLSKKAVSVALKKGIIRNVDGWSFIYSTPDNVNSLKAAVECPVPPKLL
jgi:hypothetical protein